MYTFFQFSRLCTAPATRTILVRSFENNNRLIRSSCEVFAKTIGSYLPLCQTINLPVDHNTRPLDTIYSIFIPTLSVDPAYYVLKEEDSPCILGSIDKQRWSYACAKQLVKGLIYAEGSENGLEFTTVMIPSSWIGPIPGIDGPSEGVPRILACFSNSLNLLRGPPLKLVDGGLSQRTFVYIKDAIDASMLMIESPARANVHIFNVGNPHNEVTVRHLAEMTTENLLRGQPLKRVDAIDAVMLLNDPAYYVLKEEDSPCILGSIDKQRWSYACAKQLVKGLIYAEGSENGLEFTTVMMPSNWIGPIPGIDGPSEGVPRILACFSNSLNLLRGPPLKLMDGGLSQRTFVYIKDAIDASMLMIESPARANVHIFNVGNPHNEVTVRHLAEMTTENLLRGQPLKRVDAIDAVMLLNDPAYSVLKEDDSPCILVSIDKQRWSYAFAKLLVEYAEGAEAVSNLIGGLPVDIPGRLVWHSDGSCRKLRGSDTIYIVQAAIVCVDTSIKCDEKKSDSNLIYKAVYVFLHDTAENREKMQVNAYLPELIALFFTLKICMEKGFQAPLIKCDNEGVFLHVTKYITYKEKHKDMHALAEPTSRLYLDESWRPNIEHVHRDLNKADRLSKQRINGIGFHVLRDQLKSS